MTLPTKEEVIGYLLASWLVHFALAGVVMILTRNGIGLIIATLLVFLWLWEISVVDRLLIYVVRYRKKERGEEDASKAV